MNQRSDLGPYERLGIAADASFDVVQEAKQARLAEVGDDTMARSRIEAAYDSVLMDRLKERQQGKVSSAAKTASQREQATVTAKGPALKVPGLKGGGLKVPAFKVPAFKGSMPGLPAMPGMPSLPSLALPTEPLERWLPVAVFAVLFSLILFVPGAPAELLLALATGTTVVSLQRRNRRFLPAVLWGFGLLAVGLLLGGLLNALVVAALPDPLIANTASPQGLAIGPLQLQSLPALVMLLLGALLIVI
ncbi:CPP1-like family protein [Cyanobium sp. HWJ4-Hawea]|uniref:CPP1-like family protein n=1 Tax=Cyanobium sp. HWJ4-Hawea TaxID=2823713 RepID=UPI0020CC4765|nr:CPP1-like family protein [Cyanobium sp. HWJ4-Hawea]MCP9809957.1 CPP1-like family protein [Cyanobium sp. HWJ4-Hawea]